MNYREWVKHQRVKPAFMIIGAQKCGTSWLHEHLRRHPALFLPEDKDFEFLSYAGHLHDAGWQQRWTERFRTAGAEIVGDACVSLLWNDPPLPTGFNPEIPVTVAAITDPRTRFLALLRDPEVRAISAYLHHLAHAALSWDQTILDAPVELGIFDIGRYGAHLTHWTRHIHSERLCLLPAPADHPAADILQAAAHFLGIDPPPPDEHIVRTVMPGLPRREDTAGGIWVSPDHPRLMNHPPARRRMPVETDAGQRWLRVIQPGERAHLRDRYRRDVVKLHDWLQLHRPLCPLPLAWMDGYR